METIPNKNATLVALRDLTLEEVETRLAEIDGERASLSLLRRSIAAKLRAKKRTQQRAMTQPEERNG